MPTSTFSGRSNYGLSWSYQALEQVTASVAPQPLPCGIQSSAFDNLPAVAIASPTVWWVLTGHPSSLSVTTDAGTNWRTVTSGLPSLHDALQAFAQVPILQAASPTVAWLFATFADGRQVFDQTTDGGRTWQPVKI